MDKNHPPNYYLRSCDCLLASLKSLSILAAYVSRNPACVVKLCDTYIGGHTKAIHISPIHFTLVGQ